MTDQQKADLIRRAKQLYAEGSNDDIEIDENCDFSESDQGYWVAAWVHVPNEG